MLHAQPRSVKQLSCLTTNVSYDTKVDVSTKTVNLRDLPEEVVRRAKACAALHGLTLRDFFVKAVEAAVEKDIPTFSLTRALLGERRRKRQLKRKK